MSEQKPPLILVTNDDGITSPGLLAAARAVLPLGELLVVAPDRQWSGAARSMPPGPQGHIARYAMRLDGRTIEAYQVDGSPALVLLHAVLELAPRPPALVISGINYGENLGTDVTVSGTVGAALQAGAMGIPALASSLQTPQETHKQHSDAVDFSTAAHFTRLFARRLLTLERPHDVDVLKLDVPDDATPETPWRLTRVSRQPYYLSFAPERSALSEPQRLDYGPIEHPERTAPDSDIYALAVDRVVSLAPLSIDLTARVDRDQLERRIRSKPAPVSKQPQKAYR
jgi:5'-nucleotidase